MKKVLFVLSLTFASFVGFAQEGIEGFKFGAGINLAIPASNFDGFSIGAGIDLLGRYGVSENVAITADAGYTSMFGKSGLKNYGIIPIRAGVRYYPSESFFIAGKAGVGILTYSGSSTTATAYSFGGGYAFTPKMDVSATYDGYSKNGSSGIVNIRLGYTFGN